MTTTDEDAALRQVVIWSGSSVFLLVDVSFGNLLTKPFLPWLWPTLIFYIETVFLATSMANGIYCFFTYLSILSRKISSKNNVPGSIKSMPSVDDSLSSEASLKRHERIEPIRNYLSNFFRNLLAIGGGDSAEKTKAATSYYATLLEADSKNTSLSSLVNSSRDSSNASFSNIFTRSQLERMLNNENCDTMADTRILPFSSDMISRYPYQTGIPYTPGKFLQSALEKMDTMADKDIARSQRKHTAEALPTIETDLERILKHYSLTSRTLELCEIKLRIWLCNTILRPLLHNINELNKLLGERFSSLHLRIGASSVDMLKNGILHRQELCNTALPFVLPYLQAHHNQTYLVRRIQELAENVALEDFKWNKGGVDPVRDDKNEVTRFIGWSEQFPTDTDLLWSFLCTYMDFHLSPGPNASVSGDLIRSFSTVYFVKSPTANLPIGTKNNPDAFFIRMISQHPPNFELVIRGGDVILQPVKDSTHNFWVTLTIFLRHCQKFNGSRIGHLHLSTLSLDIFDL